MSSHSDQGYGSYCPRGSFPDLQFEIVAFKLSCIAISQLRCTVVNRVGNSLIGFSSESLWSGSWHPLPANFAIKPQHGRFGLWYTHSGHGIPDDPGHGIHCRLILQWNLSTDNSGYGIPIRVMVHQADPGHGILCRLILQWNLSPGRRWSCQMSIRPRLDPHTVCNTRPWE